MLFNSYSFIFLYLPVVVLGFFMLGRRSHRWAAAWLAVASLFFYGYWNPAYVILLMASIGANYGFGRAINRAALAGLARRSRLTLTLAVSANLVLLAYYKYANFFVGAIDPLFGAHLALGNIILPLGISFFTFTQIAFLVDTYQRKVAEYSFVHYTVFVTYFPHLIAGPVLHHKEMMPQFDNPANYAINWRNVASGLMLFALGLVKKTLWADALAPFANGIFNGVQQGGLPTAYEAWAGALTYTLQIYFDFSGYTDMAVGIALIFNIRLPFNFNSPYKASSMIEFWRRWHMTLSRFLRDYLYIPLGGNQHGAVRRYLNLMATMVLGGLWHGAGWTFIGWGALHGFYLMVNHGWRACFPNLARHGVAARIRVMLSCLLTFTAVVVAWVLFRSADFSHALVMLKAMFGIAARPIALHAVLHGNLLMLVPMSGRDLVKLLVLALAWVWLLPNSMRVKFVDGHPVWVLAQALVVAAAMLLAIDQFGSYSPFLYFQF
jgi:D-alanyl-lipoteichoic acid acyltransferase DltB (MBOAT superfamily)